jgi:hypothetical protein
MEQYFEKNIVAGNRHTDSCVVVDAINIDKARNRIVFKMKTYKDDQACVDGAGFSALEYRINDITEVDCYDTVYNALVNLLVTAADSPVNGATVKDLPS